MKKTYALAFGCAAVIGMSLGSSAHAVEGIAVTDGLWKMKSTTSMPMMPQPQVREHQECMKGESFSPEDFADDQTGCKLSGVSVSGNTLEWKVACSGQGGMGATTGQGHMTVNKNDAVGNMSMTMDMGGQPMTMSVKWEGKRVGDCP